MPRGFDSNDLLKKLMLPVLITNKRGGLHWVGQRQTLVMSIISNPL